MDTPPPPTPEAKPRRFGFLEIFGITLGGLLSFFRAWIWSGGTFNAEALGYAVGGVLLSGLVAYAIAGRRKARNPKHFAFVFCGLSLFFLLLEVSTHPTSIKDRVHDLTKEAAGTKPEAAGASPVDAVLRDMLRDMLDKRRSHDAAVGGLKSDLARLYSADSFSSRDSMQNSIQAVRTVVALDQDLSHQMQTLPQRVRDRVDRSSLSVSEKQEVMQGVSQALADSKMVAVRDQAVEAEAQWADVTVALYSFALANAAKIETKEKHIIIRDEHLRTSFNQKLHASQDLRKSIRDFNVQLEQLQRETLQQFGLTKKDVGLEDSPPRAR